MSLASLAGERLFFDGDNSTGVGGDMRSATSIATLMLGLLGHGRHGRLPRRVEARDRRRQRGSTVEDGTDRNFWRRSSASASRRSSGDAGGDQGAARARTGTRSSRWPTRWRPTRRSPGTTSRPSSRARRGRSWTAPYQDAGFARCSSTTTRPRSGAQGTRPRGPTMPVPRRRRRHPPDGTGTAAIGRRAPAAPRHRPGLTGSGRDPSGGRLPGILSGCGSTTRYRAPWRRSSRSSRGTSRSTPADPPCTGPRTSGTCARTCWAT